MQRKLLIGLFILGLMIVTGCSTGQEEGSLQSTAIPKGDDGNYPITIVDSLEREITIEKKPERLISLAPAVTEILFAIDGGDQLVGVTDFCDYPDEALAKPKMGGFEDPNVELIIAQDPDLIFVAAGIQEGLVKRFEDLGIGVITLDAENLEQVLANIQIAGEVIDQVEIARELVNELEVRINAVKEQVSKATHRPTVFFEIWGDPLITAGPGSFTDDLIRLAGGQNIAHDLKERFARFSLEILLERDPEIYIVQDHAHDPEDVMDRPGFEGLSAVQEGRVAGIKDDLVTLPGPRLVAGLEEIARIIHPDLF